MRESAITAEADGQRITATSTEGRGIILNASKVGSISLQIDVHIDGAELRDLLEQLLLTHGGDRGEEANDCLRRILGPASP